MKWFLDITIGLVLSLIILLIFSVLTACSTLQTQTPLPDNNVYYLNDLSMTINGVLCIGVCKPAKADSYAIKIQTGSDIDQLIVSSCARTVTPNPEDLGNKKKGYSYIYTPGLLERDAGCKLSIGSYNRDKGKISSGIIAFDNGKWTLSAGISCNGSPDYGATGTAICQAIYGQRMAVWFQRKVRLSPSKILDAIVSDDKSTSRPVDERCAVKNSVDGRMWKFELPIRECGFLFETVDAPYEQFFLNTIGAEKVPIRGE